MRWWAVAWILQADESALTVNLPVFVRAGRDLYGHLEAFQMIWGEITAR